MDFLLKLGSLSGQQCQATINCLVYDDVFSAQHYLDARLRQSATSGEAIRDTDLLGKVNFLIKFNVISLMFLLQFCWNL